MPGSGLLLWARLPWSSTMPLGFASSRLRLAIALEAMHMVEEDVAYPEDIDNAMIVGYKHQSGPLRTTDIIGLDVRLGIAEYLESTLGPVLPRRRFCGNKSQPMSLAANPAKASSRGRRKPPGLKRGDGSNRGTDCSRQSQWWRGKQERRAFTLTQKPRQCSELPQLTKWNTQLE